MSAPTTFERAVEAKDLGALNDLLAPDVAFLSPVVYRPYEGRELVSKVLAAASRVFEDFEYVRRLESDNQVALVFRARVGDREVDGLDLVRFDDDGLVSELTVMVRPMSGVHALAAAMAEEFERLGITPPKGNGDGG
jgi:SnoaL-like domain